MAAQGIKATGQVYEEEDDDDDYDDDDDEEEGEEMSADLNDAHAPAAQNPAEFFESIGNKVQGLSAADHDDAIKQDQEYRPVEEIESLCMNCGENVSARHAGLSARDRHPPC